MRYGILAVLVAAAPALAIDLPVGVSAHRHWEPKSARPEVVRSFRDNVAAAKTRAEAEINARIACLKQQRAAILCTPSCACPTDVTGFRTITGGTILRFDSGADVVKHGQIRQCDEQLVALYGIEKRIDTDGLWLPPPQPLAWHVGSFGILPNAVRVARVIDDRNVVAESGSVTFWLANIDARTLVDGQPLQLQQAVWISGTRKYAIGSEPSHTVLQVEPFNIASSLVAVSDDIAPVAGLHDVLKELADVGTVVADVSARADHQMLIRVRKGDRIHIVATGTWCVRTGQRSLFTFGPTGGSDPTSYRPFGYLQVRVGVGAPMNVGNELTFAADADGVLNSDAADDDRSDNDGSVRVSASILR